MADVFAVKRGENDDEPQFFPNPNPAVPCSIFNCRRPAKWFVGRPDGPLGMTTLKVCDECARTILRLLPDELRQEILPEPEPETPELEAGGEGTGEGGQAKQYVCVCGKAFDDRMKYARHCATCEVRKNGRKG